MGILYSVRGRGKRRANGRCVAEVPKINPLQKLGQDIVIKGKRTFGKTSLGENDQTYPVVMAFLDELLNGLLCHEEPVFRLEVQ